MNIQERREYYMRKYQFETDSYDLYNGIQKGVNVIVIDERSPESYRKKHIPTAINVPHRTMGGKGRD